MKVLLKNIAEGEKVAEAIREGSRKALAQKKASGNPIGTITAQSNASIASARSRGQKTDMIVERIAAVLAEDPAYQTLTHKALADLLNRRRILTGWDREWSETSVRTQHRKAKELLAERTAMEVELDAEVALDTPSDTSSVDQKAPTTPMGRQERVLDEADTELMHNPLFGMF